MFVTLSGRRIKLQLYLQRVPRRPPAVYFPHHEEHFDCFVDEASNVLFIPGFEDRLSRRALILGAVRRFAGEAAVADFRKQLERQGGWPAVDALESEGVEPNEPGQPRRVPLDD